MSWYRESWRHSLAAKGISTSQRRSFMPVHFYNRYDPSVRIHSGRDVHYFNELMPSDKLELRMAQAEEEGDVNYEAALKKVQNEVVDRWRKENANIPKGVFEVYGNGDLLLNEEEIGRYIGVPSEIRIGDNVAIRTYFGPDVDDLYAWPAYSDAHGLRQEDVRKQLLNLAYPKEKVEKVHKLAAALDELQKKIKSAMAEVKYDDDVPFEGKWFVMNDSDDKVEQIRYVMPVGKPPEIHLIPEIDVEYELEKKDARLEWKK